MLTRILTSTLCALLLAGAVQAQTTVFDSLTNRTSTSIPTAANTFMGQVFSVASPGSFLLSSFQVAIVNGTGTNFASTTTFRLRTQFYGAANTGASPVFSSPVGSTISVNFTNFAWTSGTFTTLTVNLGTPLLIPSTPTTNLGVVFNLQADTGAGFVSQDNLTVAVRGGGTNPAPLIGAFTGYTSPNYGYLRNASGRTDFNFDSTDARSIGVNSGLAFRLIAAAPEPSTLALSLLGVASAGRLLRRRRQG